MDKSIFIVFNDSLLGNNNTLSRSIGFMWVYNVLDMIFIPGSINDRNISIKIKTLRKNINNTGCLPRDDFEKMKLNIKLVCNLNILQSIPQTGSFSIAIDSKKYAIRASFHPTNNGESLCLRLIKENIFAEIDPIKNLGKGLNIIGGKTCSGKTTLLYSSIINYPGHVITLEDPVEIEIPKISQTDVSIMGYEEGIKSALRQSPDLIVIGEIRDRESAKAAIKAALTGHKVLATIHILSPNHIVTRLKDLGCDFIEEVLGQVFYVENFQWNSYEFNFQNQIIFSNSEKEKNKD